MTSRENSLSAACGSHRTQDAQIATGNTVTMNGFQISPFRRIKINGAIGRPLTPAFFSP